VIQLTNVGVLELPVRPQPAPFFHPQALVETSDVGAGTRIWAFAHVLDGAVIGRDCNVCDHTFIENDVDIGDRVTIKSGVYIWTGALIEDDVFIGPNVTFTNDRRPRSKRYPPRYETLILRRGCSIGAAAVLLPGIEIGEYAMIGAGAVVTRSVPAHALVVGNPARVVGAVCRCGRKLGEGESPPFCRSCHKPQRLNGSAA
jgi:acetyltransferase-like isoleucine patch superfamily enzyme